MTPVGTDRYQTIQHPHYPTIPTLTKFLTTMFCYCSYTCAVQIITTVFLLYICKWFGVIRFLSSCWADIHPSYYSDVEGPADCGSAVCIAEGADEVGDRQSGNNTSVGVETPLVGFLEDFHTWGLLLSCRSIGIFVGSALRLN
jgi:hypothetical protein